MRLAASVAALLSLWLGHTLISSTDRGLGKTASVEGHNPGSGGPVTAAGRWYPSSRPAAPRVSRSRAPEPRTLSHPTYGGEFILTTTAYTWTGNRTASGKWPRVGMAASNLFTLGTRLWVQGVGRVVVEDRIGHGSELDIYMPSEHQCIQFGRRHLRVVVLR